MLAKHHLIVLVFAGGCISGATIIGLWREDVASTARDASEQRKVERYREAPSADSVDDDAEGADVQHAVSDVPASPRTAESDTEPPTETGSSVADVLHGLEIAYRQNLAAPPPQPTAATAPAPPRETPAHEATAVAAAAPPAAKTYAPTAAAPPAAAPPARAAAATEDAPQKLAARDDPRPRDVYYGEVHQNNNVGTVNEGNVYVIEQYVPYYVPYVAYPRRDGSAPPAYAPRPMPRKPSGSIGSSQGTFSYTDSVFKYPVELVH